MMRYTERDGQILGWIGGLGAAGAEHVMARFGMGPTPAYRRLRLMVNDGLLTRHRLLYGRPSLYLATRRGLRWCGLEDLGVHQVAPGTFEHAWLVADAAVKLTQGLPGWQMWSERELRWHEQQKQKLVASVRVGARGGDYTEMHRPDLVLISPSERVVAIEVELSAKVRKRLVRFCRGWARTRHVDAVYYLAAPWAATAVRKAVRETRTEDRVCVFALGQAGAIVVREQGGDHGLR